MNKTSPLLIVVLSTCALLAACAQTPHTPETTAPTATPEPPASTAAEAPARAAPPARPFTSETLYALLAAELASSRDRLDIALANYYQQAYATRDPQVAARATLYARFLNAESIALETSLLWIELSPDDSEAQLNAALALMQAGRLQEALTLSAKLKAQGEHTLFQNIAAHATALTDTQREQLLEHYQALRAQYPDDEQLLVGTGLLLQQQGQPEAALVLARRALALNPRSTPGAILEANLLHQMGHYDQAIARLAELVESYPYNSRLRLQYARLLTQTNLALAQEQFELLVEQHPDDAELLLPLGIIALERGDRDTAEASLERLLDLNQQRAAAHFYLGQLAEAEERTQDALMHYLQVESGPDFYAASNRALNLFVRSEDLVSAEQYALRLRTRHPEHAEAFFYLHAQALNQQGYLAAAEAAFSQGIEQFPESSQLLYARAMLHDNRGDLTRAEQDLRTLLKYDPNNAHGLNALGYILADRTERYQEAFDLISKALAIMPDEAAIIDSMGWVHYRLGNHEQALAYLRRAMKAFPDHEIAAHLGEVLWVTGAQREARSVWQQGLELTPDSPIIRETMQRLITP